uniref:Ig-like domain-containing protein n=1 Tax=Sinocyclocheilus rhinocerous TaxID=307959 RepID=A0A673KES5_9TELE
FLTWALPLKDSCVLVGPEIPDYRVQGGAVIIRFPFLEDAVNNRRLRVDSSSVTADFQSTALPTGKGQYTVERGIILAIKNISVKDEGFYTCRLSVIFNNTQYNVSRTWRVQVSYGRFSVTSNRLSAFTSSSHSFPYIVFPANGSFTASHLGARLVIQCMVSVGNQLAQSTDVTWMGNDQPPENSDLRGRAFQTDKSCGILCFMLVLCAFADHLCRRPQKPRDYVLARQHSAM